MTRRVPGVPGEAVRQMYLHWQRLNDQMEPEPCTENEAIAWLESREGGECVRLTILDLVRVETMMHISELKETGLGFCTHASRNLPHSLNGGLGIWRRPTYAEALAWHDRVVSAAKEVTEHTLILSLS